MVLGTVFYRFRQRQYFSVKAAKLIEVNWKTARLMLTKVRAAMGHRDIAKSL